MSDYINSDGTFGDLTNAPEAVKTFAESKGFKSVDDIIGMATNLESMKGEWANPESMKLPDTFSEDHMALINERLGVPKSIDAYTIPEVEGVELDDDAIKAYKEASLAVGKTQAQIDADINFYGEMIKRQEASDVDVLSKLHEKGVAELQTLWGDKYDDNTKLADSVAIKLGLSDTLTELGLLSNPKMIEALHKIGLATEEGSLGSNPDGGTPVKTKEERIKEITESEAFKDRLHPDHKAIHAEWLKLYTG